MISIYTARQNRVSDYNSRQEVLEFWNKQMKVSEGTFQPQVVSVAESDDGHLVLLRMYLSKEKDGAPGGVAPFLHL
jgi:hypothetical protein